LPQHALTLLKWMQDISRLSRGKGHSNRARHFLLAFANPVWLVASLPPSETPRGKPTSVFDPGPTEPKRRPLRNSNGKQVEKCCAAAFAL